MWFRLNRIIFIALLILGWLAPGHSALSDEVIVRGTKGDGFARLTFRWPVPVSFLARIKDRNLIVQFGRPVESKFADLPGKLGSYIGMPRLGGEGQTITIPLKNDYDLNYNSRGKLITVDLIELAPQAPAKRIKQDPKSTPNGTLVKSRSANIKRPEKSNSAVKAPQKKTLVSMVAAANMENVKIRTGQHPEYGRLVFDWSKKVAYKFDRQGNRAAIKFGRPAKIDFARDRVKQAKNVGGGESRVTASETLVILKVPSSSRIRHFRSGPKVVVDVFNPTKGDDSGAPPQKSFKQAGTVSPAKPPKMKSEPAVVKQAKVASTLQDSSSKKTERNTAAAAVPGAPVTLDPGTQPRNAGGSVALKSAAKPEKVAKPGKTTLKQSPGVPAAVPADAAASIRLDWKQPVAAAVFRRAGALWIVFDKANRFDTAQIKDQSRNILLSADQVSAQRGTFLRFTTPEGFNPSIRRDGLAWIFDFKKQPLKPQTSLKIQVQTNKKSGPSLLLPVAQAGEAIPFHDASVGDNLIVIPVIPLSHGVDNERRYPQVRFLGSAQGVVVQPKIDNLQARSLKAGIIVAYGRGLLLSNVAGKGASGSKITSLSSTTRIFKPDVWRAARRKGMSNFLERKRELMAIIAASRGSKKQTARRRLAEYLFSQNFGYEALGVLQTLVSFDPELINDPKYRMLRGGSHVLVGRYKEAAEDLGAKTLDDNDEGAFWRAINLAAQGKFENAAPILKEKGRIMRSYPKRLKLPLGLLITEAAIRAGDVKFATNYLQIVSDEEPDPKEVDQLALLEGKLQQLAGGFDAAVEAWEAAAEGEHQPSIANAIVNRIDLLMLQKKIKAKEAIEELEGLRYFWRGGDFEFALLRKLGRYYLDIKDYKNGLSTLKAAASNFRGHEFATEVTKEMANAFKELYLNDAADEMQPVQAIALFDEFKELTPSGKQGDEMIRKLADRLAQVDLFDRAAKLLNQQVNFRLKGVDRARVGARLATVRILNKEPELAIEALQKSDDPSLPGGLATQRAQLKARALIDLGQPQEAIDVLKEDESQEADLLRGEVFWKAKAWPQVVDVFKRLVQSTGATPGRQLTERQALFVLNLAVALTFADFDTGSARLLGKFGAAMDATAYKDAFRLIASTSESGLADFRTVASKVKTASNFKSFMDSYKQSLKQGNLSQLN